MGGALSAAVRIRRAIASVALALVAFPAIAGFGGSPDRPADKNTQAAPLLERTHDFSQDVPGGYGTLLKLTSGPLGSARFVAWRKRTIHIDAHIVVYATTEQDLDRMQSVVGVVIDPSVTTIEIQTAGPHEDRWLKGVKNFPRSLKKMPFRVDYVVSVPEFTAVDAAVYDGDLELDGVSGVSSLTNARGNIHITNASGSIVANAIGGSIDISTVEKSWHGGSLRVTAAHDVSLAVPHGFSGYFDVTAHGGISIAGEEPREVGPTFRGDVGNGGGGVLLTAGGKVVVTIGRSAP